MGTIPLEVLKNHGMVALVAGRTISGLGAKRIVVACWLPLREAARRPHTAGTNVQGISSCAPGTSVRTQWRTRYLRCGHRGFGGVDFAIRPHTAGRRHLLRLHHGVYSRLRRRGTPITCRTSRHCHSRLSWGPACRRCRLCRSPCAQYRFGSRRAIGSPGAVTCARDLKYRNRSNIDGERPPWEDGQDLRSNDKYDAVIAENSSRENRARRAEE